MTKHLDEALRDRLIARATCLMIDMRLQITALESFAVTITAQRDGASDSYSVNIFERQRATVLSIAKSVGSSHRDVAELLRDLRAMEVIPTHPEPVSQVFIEPIKGEALVREINESAADSRLYQRPVGGTDWIDDEDYEKHGDDPHDQDIYYDDDEDAEDTSDPPTSAASAQKALLEEIAGAVEDALTKLNHSGAGIAATVMDEGLTLDMPACRIHMKVIGHREDEWSYSATIRCGNDISSWYGIADADTPKDAVREAGQMVITALYDDIEFWTLTPVSLKADLSGTLETGDG